MKKIIIALLIFTITVTSVGCGAQQNTGADVNTTTTTAQQKIDLTTENISDYLSFTCHVSDVETDTFYFVTSGSGTATLKTSPLRAGTFENVVLKVTLEPNESTRGWDSFEREITLPFDGKFDDTFSIESSTKDFLLSSDPEFIVVVNSVSGQLVI